jgi:preprotein translocase SecE subunit
LANRKETTITTAMVFVMVVLASLFFLAVDSVLGTVVESSSRAWDLKTMAHRWYVIHVYSGFERKVAQSIREQAEQKGLSEAFAEIMVPTEEVVESAAAPRSAPNASSSPAMC